MSLHPTLLTTDRRVLDFKRQLIRLVMSDSFLSERAWARLKGGAGRLGGIWVRTE